MYIVALHKPQLNLLLEGGIFGSRLIQLILTIKI